MKFFSNIMKMKTGIQRAQFRVGEGPGNGQGDKNGNGGSVENFLK